ncbi:hypothetical protein AAMO2058_001669700, partial [Amorphochlora amoebiformis]
VKLDIFPEESKNGGGKSTDSKHSVQSFKVDRPFTMILYSKTDKKGSEKIVVAGTIYQLPQFGSAVIKMSTPSFGPTDYNVQTNYEEDDDSEEEEMDSDREDEIDGQTRVGQGQDDSSDSE